TPLNAFLATFARGNAAIWPMQLVWYASAAAIVGLAFWPRRRASQLICLLAAAYFAWIGIAYFGVLFSGTHMAWISGLLAAAFILLPWARPPAPKYLLLIPLAWGLGAGPGAMATGIVVDFGLVLAGAITAGVLIWRDRTSSWQTVAAGVVLAAMIAGSGHDDVLMVAALVLVAVTFVQTIWGDAQRLHAGRPPRPERVLTS